MEENELMVQVQEENDNGFKVDPASGLIGAGLAIGGYFAYRGVRKLGRFVKSKISKNKADDDLDSDVIEPEPVEDSKEETSEEK